MMSLANCFVALISFISLSESGFADTDDDNKTYFYEAEKYVQYNNTKSVIQMSDAAISTHSSPTPAISSVSQQSVTPAKEQTTATDNPPLLDVRGLMSEMAGVDIPSFDLESIIPSGDISNDKEAVKQTGKKLGDALERFMRSCVSTIDGILSPLYK